MDFASLEIFCAVAAEGSVTRAARVLGRVQSNVTTRLRQLEEELGAALFLRDGKRMLPTAAGLALLGYARQILSLGAEARLAVLPGAPAGVLRLGSMEATAASRLPWPLMACRRQWPQLDVQLTTGTTGALCDAVRERALDCALVALAPGQAPDGGLLGTPVFSEELMLVLPAGHAPVATPADVGALALAGFARGCTYRRIAEDWLKGDNSAVKRPATLEMGSYHAILACVAAGTHVAIMPRSVLALYAGALPVETLFVMRVETLLVRRGAYRSAGFDALLAALADSAGGTAAAPSAES